MYDHGLHRDGGHDRPHPLEDCVGWLRRTLPVDGNFLVFQGRDGGVVQAMWHEPPDSGGPRLWLETPEPELRRSRGRYMSLDEAGRMITILAREDRVALDELGALTTV